MRIVSTRHIQGIYRTRDMYNWTTFDDDAAEDAVVSLTESAEERKRRLTAERVRRYREREKVRKNSLTAGVAR